MNSCKGREDIYKRLDSFIEYAEHTKKLHDVLQTVFEDGRLKRRTSLKEIRAKVAESI